MSGVPALDSHTRSGVFGLLKSWLQARPKELGAESAVLPIQDGVPIAPFCGLVRVLVVDDNPVNLMVMTALLESRGLVPLLAADGAEAVALACELQFELILMDLQMPILDGLGATSAIRRYEAQCSRHAVPVVAYSSSCVSTDILLRHGLNGALAKPCEDQDLEDCLVRWCPSYRPAPAKREVAYGHGVWQPTRQAPGTDSALRG